MTIHSARFRHDEAPALATVSPAALHAALRGGGEIAVIDVREGGRFETGHISLAVPLPLSEIEFHVERLLPRKTIRVVVTDDHGGEFSHRASLRLSELGYPSVVRLDGGLAAWREAGFELITGQYSLSKALGEFIERHHNTPRIGVGELARRIREGTAPVILDTRPLEEFTHVSIPGGVAAPGAELLYRIFDAVPSPDTPIVINCAGRTRAILGAQILLNAGLPNPVVSLENGTTAWILAGLTPGQGSDQRLPPPSTEGIAHARAAAERVGARFDVRHIDAAGLAALKARQEEISLYLLDVRTPEEYLAGHLPESISAPGGQVVQTTDAFIGTRGGTVVLVDNEDAVRATVTASWLTQMGLDNVHVHASPRDAFSDVGPARARLAGGEPAVSKVTAREAEALLREGAVVIDVEPAGPYFSERRSIPGSLVARRSTLPQSLPLIPGRGPILITSADGRLASLATSELEKKTPREVVALEGGTRAWQEAGLPTRTGPVQIPLLPGEAIPAEPTLEERRANLDAYVRWGGTIVAQLKRDGLVRFRAPSPR